MKKVLTIIWVACAIVTTGFAAEDGVSQTEPPSIFYQAVQPELTKELVTKLESYSKSNSISPEAADHVRELVSGQTLQSCGENADKDREKRQAIWEIGRGALPVISELMVVQDEKLRLKAILSTVKFRFMREDIRAQVVDTYKETEILLTLLYLRSLLDKDCGVRESAIGGLTGIGSERMENIPEGVKSGLLYAEFYDPDPKLREQAHYARVHLGLSPKDPNKEYADP